MLLQAGCRSPIDPMNNPVMIGDGNLGENDVHSLHSDEAIGKATLAWTILIEEVTYCPLLFQMYKTGSPSEAWAAINTWYAPHGRVS